MSYSWDDDAHKAWVAGLAKRLRSDGVNVILDQWHVRLGDQLPQFMETSVRASDFVLIVCTPRYKEKSDERSGGAGYEGHIITAEIFEYSDNPRKFIPVLRLGEWRQAAPSWLLGKARADLRGEPYREAEYHTLMGTIRGILPDAPPIGPGQHVAGSQPPPAQLFTVPLPENPFFTGREKELDGLKNSLERSGIAALTGLGGMGKTQTAAHYAHRHRKDYAWVLWVKAESQATLFADLAQMAGRLQLPEREAKEQSVIVEAMQRWLDEHEGWLLVLDNVEDFAVVRELARKAQPKGHHVIITTQRQALGQIARQGLTPMDNEQGALLLLRRANRLPEDLKGRVERAFRPASTPSTDCHPEPTFVGEGSASPASSEGVPLQNIDAAEAALAREISEEVGGLPLALDQAGAYIEETGCGLDDYRTRLRQRFKELAERRGGVDDSDHPDSMAATFEMSFEKLVAQNPAAAELLQAAAFLAPDAIPEEIFTEGAAKFGARLQAAAFDALQWDEAIGAAFKFSLLERKPAKLLAVHRMVQAVAKSRMSAEEQKQWAEQVVRAVNAAFPGVEFAAWGKCERLTPSAQACAALVEEYRISSAEAARLFHRAGWYLRDRARYAEAEPIIRESVLASEKANRSGISACLNNLAILLKNTNRLSEAEPLMRRALEIDEKAYGPEHPDVATDLNNLALLLKNTNRLSEAEPLMRRALHIDEKALGPEHPDVAIDLNNLALLLQDTNRLSEAEPLMRRALEIREKALGPDHPDVAQSLNNLATLLQDTNRLSEAEPMMRRALAIFEKSLGPQHPDVAQSLNNLALLLQDTNRLSEAEPMMRRALAISEKSLGPEHPDVAQSLNNLATLLQDTNRLSEAEPMMRRALEILEKSLGGDHPRTITVRGNLAGLLRQMGKGSG